MDPKAAIEAIMRGERPAEHARAYNEWRKGQGFAVSCLVNMEGAGEANGWIDRVYRGHRGWKARVELSRARGCHTYALAALELV